MISAIPVTALAHACGGRLNRHRHEQEPLREWRMPVVVD